MAKIGAALRSLLSRPAPDSAEISRGKAKLAEYKRRQSYDAYMASTAVEDAVAEINQSVKNSFVFTTDAKALLAVVIACASQWFSTHQTVNLLETMLEDEEEKAYSQA